METPRPCLRGVEPLLDEFGPIDVVVDRGGERVAEDRDAVFARRLLDRVLLVRDVAVAVEAERAEERVAASGGQVPLVDVANIEIEPVIGIRRRFRRDLRRHLIPDLRV
jgi:hypothetical protein